jgi:exopolyphosphatase/guanosine-5'-triphosphate,3'-diphosphate pyrophosphatase
MRVAIIDLGTNSVRFDVHSISAKGKPRLLHREKRMIRLGQGVFLKKRMSPAAMLRALQAFDHFQKVAGRLKCKKIVAIGTSVLREAANSADFVKRVRVRTGIELKSISGKEEANLIALGVLANEKLPRGAFALVDIGGGSTEISICRGGAVCFAESFPLGTARLQQVFLQRSPPKAAALRKLRARIHALLDANCMKKRPRISNVVASSGTARALAKLLGEGENAFGLKALSRLVAQMEGMNRAQLLKLPAMEAKRVEMVLAGALLLEEIVSALGAKRVLLSEYALRDGMIEAERKRARA